MIGRADLILSGVQGPVTADQQRSLEMLIGHAERLAVELQQTAERFDDYVRLVLGSVPSGTPDPPER